MKLGIRPPPWPTPKILSHLVSELWALGAGLYREHMSPGPYPILSSHSITDRFEVLMHLVCHTCVHIRTSSRPRVGISVSCPPSVLSLDVRECSNLSATLAGNSGTRRNDTQSATVYSNTLGTTRHLQLTQLLLQGVYLNMAHVCCACRIIIFDYSDRSCEQGMTEIEVDLSWMLCCRIKSPVLHEP